jgi:hypothetical protein
LRAGSFPVSAGRDPPIIGLGLRLGVRVACAMDDIISSTGLQQLLGINATALSELARDGMVVRAAKRGTYQLAPSVSGYVKHLRGMAAGWKPPAKLPVKTRLPIQAWIFAGLVTLFSLASSLTHLARRPLMASSGRSPRRALRSAFDPKRTFRGLGRHRGRLRPRDHDSTR